MGSLRLGRRSALMEGPLHTMPEPGDSSGPRSLSWRHIGEPEQRAADIFLGSIGRASLSSRDGWCKSSRGRPAAGQADGARAGADQTGSSFADASATTLLLDGDGASVPMLQGEASPCQLPRASRGEKGGAYGSSAPEPNGPPIAELVCAVYCLCAQCDAHLETAARSPTIM